MAAGKGKERWLALLLFLGALVLSSGASFVSHNEALAESGVSSDPVAPPTPPTSLPPLVKVPFNWFDGLKEKEQRLVTIIACVLMMLMGIFFVIFGYRIFRPTLALVGFVVVFVLIWIVLTTHTNNLKWWAILLISLAVALVAGFLCFFIYQIGIALLGSALGFTVSSLILATPLGTKVITNAWAHFGIILGFCLIFAVLAIIFQRLLIIIGTSSLGAYLFCNAIDIAWLKTGILSNIVVQFFAHNLHDIPPINTTNAYILLGGDIGLILFGILVQYGITARNFHHQKASEERKRSGDDREGLLVNDFYRDV